MTELLNGVTILRRMDGSVDFARGWDYYKAGFGDIDGEMWLGLEEMHQLSISHEMRLRVEMSDFSGVHYWAEYSRFSVGPESDNYTLDVSGYDATSTAGNGLDADPSILGYVRHSGQQFTTAGRDNDEKIGEY